MTSDPARNYLDIRGELADDVTLVVAAKGRTPAEVAAVLDAGATVIGENYVQEAVALKGALGEGAARAEWHMIGHLQRNKVRQALPLFDVVQGVDSVRLAGALDRAAERPVRVLVEVNVGGEESKFGVAPEGAAGLVRGMSELPNLRVEGLMTMEPYCADPEDARPYFRRMRELFAELGDLAIPGVTMDVLSMGMTHSWRVAVQEASTMVRIGTAIFGPRG